MLKAVLFDLDDTLIDWSGFKSDWDEMESRHIGHVVDVIKNEGRGDKIQNALTVAQAFRTRTKESWLQAGSTLRAPNMTSILKETLEAFGVDTNDDDIRRYLEAYQWGAVPGTQIFPEVQDVLQILVDTGIKIGIVTNAFQPMWLRDIEIDAHGLLRFFPEITYRHSAADVGYLKPHPEIFQKALASLGTTPAETVFVGDDLEADIAGAQGAGIQAILRRTARYHGKTLRISPDAIVNDLHEMLVIFDQWYPGWRNQ